VGIEPKPHHSPTGPYAPPTSEDCGRDGSQMAPRSPRVKAVLARIWHEEHVVGNGRGTRAAFGSVRKLPSGRFQARYTVPRSNIVITAPTTFATKAPAQAWLRREGVRLESVAAGAPAAKMRPPSPSFRAFAEQWFAARPLRPSTARTYRVYLDRYALPSLGDRPLDAITADVIKSWHSSLAPNAPTVRARAYAMVKTIFSSAVEEGLIGANPCRVHGASTARVKTEITTATPEQVAALADAMPERLRLAVLLGAWCQLRVGETLALRRRDLDTSRAVVHVVRGVTWQGPTPTFGPPKTRAGVRTVHMPESMISDAVAHLRVHVDAGEDALLFATTPGRPIHLSWFGRRVKAASEKAGLPPTFRFHHLRHTGLTLLASAGASVAELQARAGHATAGVALRYQHARAERDRALANKLATLATTRY
jgi:integrase